MSNKNRRDRHRGRRAQSRRTRRGRPQPHVTDGRYRRVSGPHHEGPVPRLGGPGRDALGATVRNNPAAEENQQGQDHHPGGFPRRHHQLPGIVGRTPGRQPPHLCRHPSVRRAEGIVRLHLARIPDPLGRHPDPRVPRAVGHQRRRGSGDHGRLPAVGGGVGLTTLTEAAPHFTPKSDAGEPGINYAVWLYNGEMVRLSDMQPANPDLTMVTSADRRTWMVFSTDLAPLPAGWVLICPNS